MASDQADGTVDSWDTDDPGRAGRVELDRQLAEIARSVADLKAEYARGEISRSELEARCRTLTALDASSSHWRLDPDGVWSVEDTHGALHRGVDPQAYVGLETRLRQRQRKETVSPTIKDSSYYGDHELFWPRLISVVFGTLTTIAAIAAAFAVATADPSILVGAGLPQSAQLAVAVAGLACAAVPATLVGFTLTGSYRTASALLVPLVLLCALALGWSWQQGAWAAAAALAVVSVAGGWSALVLARSRNGWRGFALASVGWIAAACVATACLAMGSDSPPVETAVAGPEAGVEVGDFYTGGGVSGDRERAQLLADLLAADSAAQQIAPADARYVISASLMPSVPGGVELGGLIDGRASSRVFVGACAVDVADTVGGASKVRCR